MTAREAFSRLRGSILPERGVAGFLPYGAIAAVGLAVGLSLGTLSLAQRLDWALYDRMMTVATRDPHPPADIVVVAIDEPSFSQMPMRWPWPRRVHAALVDALVRDGARTIVLDLLFDQPGAPEEDRALADAVQRAGNVVLASDRAVTTDRRYAIEQWVEPLADLAGGAAAVAAIGMDRDPDGSVRRASAVIDGRPTLALAAAERQPGFVTPAHAERPRLIRFLGPPRRGVVTVSYYQAIEPGLLPAGTFRDKIVLVGRSLSAAAALDEVDHVRTPVAVAMSGVEVHATQIDTLLRHRAVADPFGTYRGAVLLALALGIAAGLAFFPLAPHRGVLLALAGGVLLAWTAYAGLAYGSVRVPVVQPLIAIMGVLVSTAAYRTALGQRERRMIKRAFQHFVAPAIVKRMLDDPSRLKLGGETFDVTVIFTDLEGFTSVAERLTPEELRTRLSAYFKAMMDVLLAEHATLDKFIGDAIMVYFGCPVPDAGHPQQACRAALAMQRRLDAMNAEWRLAGASGLRMRVGINTGTAVAGNMGTDEIFNYTIIGDCVNLASRFEGVNKVYGSRTIVGEATWARVQPQFEARELDRIRVKGRDQPVAIYELLAEAGGLPESARRLRDRFAEGLRLYRAQHWREAEEAFLGALAIDGADGPSRVFADRCAGYAGTPPPEPWDGVYAMTGLGGTSLRKARQFRDS